MPQQALALANSELTITQSRRLARQRDAADESEDFSTSAFQHVLSRSPTEAERAECEAFLLSQAESLADRGSGEQTTSNLADLSKPSADPQLRAKENLVHVLLNHHEFVTRR